jgi:hypothetical protein
MDGHNLDESEVIFLMRTTGANQLVGGTFFNDVITAVSSFSPYGPTFLSLAVVYVVRASCTTTVLRCFTSSTPFLTTFSSFIIMKSIVPSYLSSFASSSALKLPLLPSALLLYVPAVPRRIFPSASLFIMLNSDRKCR